MANYRLMHRLGVRPWERYAAVSGEQTRRLLERETATRTPPLGRALDLGCGRGLYTPVLAQLGWEAVGLDFVPGAIQAARRHPLPGVSYVVGDVSALDVDELGSFDFFLDIGCFQGLDEQQRHAYGRGVTSLARRGAGLMELSFGGGSWRSVAEGVTQEETEAALPDWELLSVDHAVTHGLGFPMNRTSPQWYWFRLRR